MSSPIESQRLAALDQMNLAYSPSEERFDRITRLAARLLNMPMAMVSLVHRDSTWFKSAHGELAAEHPRNVTFCATAILGDETLVVCDAIDNEIFRNSPLVIGEPFLRAYAGHPLRAADGSKVGTLCVMGPTPREFSAEDLAVLRDLAALAENELKLSVFSDVQKEMISAIETLKRKSLFDALTHSWNREAIIEVLEREQGRAERSRAPLSVIMLDIDRFKQVNDQHGHLAGDMALAEAARQMRAAVRPYDAVGRYGGDEFLLVLADCDAETTALIAERIRAGIAGAGIDVEHGRLTVTASIGTTTIAATANMPSPLELVRRADEALYLAKSAGRNCVRVAPAA